MTRQSRRHLPALLCAAALAQACGDEQGPRTDLVKDLAVGRDSSRPHGFLQVGPVTYFSADDHRHGFELWRTDGTHEGTHMVRDIVPESRQSSNPHALTRVGDRVFFAATHPDTGTELWVSDGTTAGTRLVKDISPGPEVSWDRGSSQPHHLVDVGGTLFFVADDEAHGWELWKSDGTPRGTVLVKDLYPGPVSDVAGRSVWIRNPVELRGRLYFDGHDPTFGREIWTSDGTPEGTFPVKDICPGPFLPRSIGRADVSCQPGLDLVKFRDHLYFTEAGSLWKSDGTEEGTVAVGPALGGNLTATDRYLFFTRLGRLWRTDGTPEGVLQFPAPVRIDATGRAFVLRGVGDRVYFEGLEGPLGYVLWTSDGTSAGTVLLGLRLPLTGAQFWPVGRLAYFLARTNPAEPVQLWRSDGTPGGTRPETGFPGGVERVGVPAEGRGSRAPRLYLSADDGPRGYELWAHRPSLESR